MLISLLILQIPRAIDVNADEQHVETAPEPFGGRFEVSRFRNFGISRFRRKIKEMLIMVSMNEGFVCKFTYDFLRNLNIFR